jgi:hypothetical protein
MVFSRIFEGYSFAGDWKPQKFFLYLKTNYCVLVRISAFIVYKKVMRLFYLAYLAYTVWLNCVIGHY